MTIPAIPITIDPDAQARIAELGMRREFEQMLDKAQEVVPHLNSIRVTLEHDPEGELDTQIVIWSHRDDTGTPDKTEWNYIGWQAQTFSPDVCLNFSMLCYYEAPDEWDRRMEQDALAGRLDEAGRRADEDFEAGRCTPL
jgi:hypothetical protein